MSNVKKTAFFKIEILPFDIHRVMKTLGKLKFKRFSLGEC